MSCLGFALVVCSLGSERKLGDDCVTNYEKGRRGEYELMRIYEKAGYECFRTAGSHSKADIICIRKVGEEDVPVIVIQSKRGKKPSKKEVAEFNNWNVEAMKALYWRPDGKKQWTML